jgi:hypothetical protein
MGCADQAALDTRVDPQTIAEWTRQVKAERAVALARRTIWGVRVVSERDSQLRYMTPLALSADFSSGELY